MKAILFIGLAIGCQLRGQVASMVPVSGDHTGNLTPFSFIGTDYKKPQELPENFFNPFKTQASGSDLARKEAASVTNEAVAGAIGHRGVSGIVYSPDARTDRIVVGDQVFGLGDELSFPDGDKPDFSPLVAGATVVLREVRPDNLQFDITPEGEPARRLVFSLRSFWRQ